MHVCVRISCTVVIFAGGRMLRNRCCGSAGPARWRAGLRCRLPCLHVTLVFGHGHADGRLSRVPWAAQLGWSCCTGRWEAASRAAVTDHCLSSRGCSAAVKIKTRTGHRSRFICAAFWAVPMSSDYWQAWRLVHQCLLGSLQTAGCWWRRACRFICAARGWRLSCRCFCACSMDAA